MMDTNLDASSEKTEQQVTQSREKQFLPDKETLRRQMYERIAQGNRLEEVEANARIIRHKQ